jgi:hypothetical protein
MRCTRLVRAFSSGLAFVVAGVALVALPWGAARAVDVLGIYGGASIGQSRIDTNIGTVSAGSFRENHSAWKVDFGVKPIPMFGAEAEYIHFGHPTGNVAGNPEDVDLKGTAAFGVFTLPIPVVDLFVKAGAARLDTTVNGALFHLSRTDTGFAAGAGVGVKLGAWGIRGEWERFNGAGGNPQLYTAGFTYTFL